MTTTSEKRQNAKCNLDMSKLGLQGHKDVEQTPFRKGPTLQR